MIRLLGPTPADVLEVAAEMTGVAVEDLTGPGRQRDRVAARHATCAAMRLATTASYPAIGRAMGGRDHTTVMHSVQTALSVPRLTRAAELVAAEVRRRCGEGDE